MDNIEMNDAPPRGLDVPPPSGLDIPSALPPPPRSVEQIQQQQPLLVRDMSRESYKNVLTPTSSTFKPQSLGSEFRSKIDKSVIAKELSVDLFEGEPQLTVKAIVVGCLVGIFCSFLALYYSLKTGIIPSLNILCGLGGFVLMKSLIKMRLFRGNFTPQENAVIQTAAVAVYALSSTGFGFGSGFLAMNYNSFEQIGGTGLVGNRREDTIDITWPISVLWCFALCLFGFFLAFPIRDYTIIKQKLPFPSGTVTAYVIKNLHQSEKKASYSFALMSKYFSIAFVVNIFTWIFHGLGSFPIFGIEASNFSWELDFDIGAFGIGSILNFQVNGSMLLGAIINNALLTPLIKKYKDGTGPDDWFDSNNLPGNSKYLGTYAYALFAGLAIMVVQGVFTIIILVYTLIKAYRDDKKKEKEMDAIGAVVPIDGEVRSNSAILNEIFMSSRVPVWVPYAGFFVCGAIAIVILQLQFSVHWYQTLLALFILPIFALSNVQGMGRTDWDVSSAYGKLIMFPFGAWNIGDSILPSLALCSFTICGCSNAASLLQDFKTGYLVGASPNAMFFAQIIGALFGCLVTPTLFLLLSSAFKLPNITDKGAFIQGMFGPIYRMLAVVATGSGFDALPKHILEIALGFMVFAIILDILDLVLPPKYAKFLPDPSSVSIGILVPAVVSLEFVIGGLIASWWRRWNPAAAEAAIPYIASGCVAGSGLAVVCQCLLSLMSVTSPIAVTFTAITTTMSAGQWVGAVVFILILVAVAACGMWYWHQTDFDLEADGNDEEDLPFLEGGNDGFPQKEGLELKKD